ncbi:MAG TPA: non-homologous end-joining DNA ligase [Bryobacteraceae bacterium]|nr:non-homologous end-joining DNA ligase [Bryobacteraceae bacterium]
MASSNQTVDVEGHKLQLSNLDKLLYPAAKFSKADIISYYLQAAKYLLPHLRDRPVTLLRYPEGVAAEHFYEKDAPRYTPDWVATFPVPRRAGGPDIRYILINNIATLVWCTNLANIEIHPFLHSVPKIQQPTYVVFDLDPGEGAEILDCAQVAFWLRDLFQNLKLKSFVKSSGSKGLQLYVPLNTPVSYALTQPFARAVAQYLAREHPKVVVAEMDKSLRGGKVFVDWSQNSDFKTTVGVYSLRAKRTTPFVSFPVSWEALEEAVRNRSHEHLYLHPAAAIERLEKEGDLFAPVLTLKQKLPDSFEDRHLHAAASKKRPARKSLEPYSAKRDFSKTPEPAAAAAAPRSSRQGSRRRFVIQKHAASHLHYDLRIEMHGVLKSWAVPKGMPYRENEKRLAMATEDHPLEYYDFEGVIPKGQYGGGTVTVWDLGTCEIIEGNYYKGFLRVFLDGKKLNGEWTLTKDAGSDRNWSLVKAAGGVRPVSARAEDSSALSGRSMAEIAAQRTAEWHSNRASGKASKPVQT